MIGPDATITLDFALARLVGVIDKMVVHPDTMQANLDKLHGLVFSQRVLLALTQAGMSREDAYRTVQRHAMDAWKGNGEFLDLLKTDPEVARHLDDATLTGLFDMGYHSKHVDTVFIRVFGEA
jgi:adenylosuccinate lyase